MAKISRSYRDYIRKRLLESANVKEKVASDYSESIAKAAQLIIDTFKTGNKVNFPPFI